MNFLGPSLSSANLATLQLYEEMTIWSVPATCLLYKKKNQPSEFLGPIASSANIATLQLYKEMTIWSGSPTCLLYKKINQPIEFFYNTSQIWLIHQFYNSTGF